VALYATAAVGSDVGQQLYPIVIATWDFSVPAVNNAWAVLTEQEGSVIDAVQVGCTTCEQLQCDGTVGFGGSPDETGETTLDAMIMDGDTISAGAVGNVRQVKQAVALARFVMDHTEHTFMSGDQLMDFATSMGFQLTNLSTPQSIAQWKSWESSDCQPNYRTNVVPDPSKSCGPYKPVPVPKARRHNRRSGAPSSLSGSPRTHDTIAVVAVDENGHMAAATSTNGLNHKIPGRVGDSPMVGSGAYVDSDVGGCGATGDGDIMMRFCPCYQAVENLRRGMGAKDAAEDAFDRIRAKYPNFQGGLILLSKSGDFGAAANGGWWFSYAVRTPSMQNTTVYSTNH